MERLHAGDNPELAESRNVGRGDGFNVFDARPAIALVVPRYGVFIGIQRRPHAVVADGMRQKLQTVLVQFRNRRLVVSGLPEELAFQRGIVAVWLEHRGGVRFDHAIHHKFDGLGVDPVVVEFLAGMVDSIEVLRPEFGRIEEVSDIHAHAQVAATAHFVEEIERFEILSSAVDASDAVFVGPFHACAQRQKLFDARRFWNNLGDQALS